MQWAFTAAAALVVCGDDGAGLFLAGNNKVAHGVVLSGLSACGVVAIAFDGLIIRRTDTGCQGGFRKFVQVWQVRTVSGGLFCACCQADLYAHMRYNKTQKGV